jgi:ketosteroid isomerase-like protein
MARVVLPFVLLAFLATSCSRTVPTIRSAADADSIRALEERWRTLYNARSFDALMTLYADGAVLMAPDSPMRDGKDAILRSYFADDSVNIERVETSVVEDVRVCRNLAVARGRDTGVTIARRGGRPEPYDLKWVMAFVRRPGGPWRIVYEVWNQNPAPGPSAGRAAKAGSS